MDHIVPIGLVPDIWPALEDWCAKAMRFHPFLEAPDVLEILLADRGQLFVSTDAGGILGFVVMDVVIYPRRTVANVIAAGGRHGFLKVASSSLYSLMKQWALSRGADTVAVLGRPGWTKYAIGDGGKCLTVSYSWKELGNVRRRRQSNHQHGIPALPASDTVSQ